MKTFTEDEVNRFMIGCLVIGFLIGLIIGIST